MFATQTKNKSETSAAGKPKRAEAATVGKDAPERNPLWQSLALRTTSVRPKMAVSQPGDPYEREADRVAEQVMRLPEPQLQRAGGGESSERHDVRDAGEHVQTESVRSDDSAESAAPPVVREALRSSGQPLDSTAREIMESRLGHDFSGVRVHTDARASESASAVNALAYTVGNDLVFRQGQYQPDTLTGRRVLAHELAHVVQQSRGGAAPPPLPGHGLEQAAERA